MASLAEIQSIVQQIHQDLPALIQRARVSPQQVVLIEGISDLSKRLGLIQAGEFRAGNDKEPGFGFTGGRYGYPGFSYASDVYFLAGVENDVLQVGLSLTDGKIYFGAGAGWQDSDGISVLVTSNAAGEAARSYKFVDTDGNIVAWLYDYYPAGDNFLFVATQPISGRNSTLNLMSDAPTGKYAQVTMQAAQSGGGTANIGVFADTDGTTFAELTADDFFIEADVQVTGGVDVAGALQCDSITNDTGLAAGTYTPTLTLVTNLDAAVISADFTYIRVGNIVHVEGGLTADATAAGNTVLGISLPVASNFGGSFDATGIGSNQLVNVTGNIQADTTNDRAQLTYQATVTTNQAFRVSFNYRVI